MSQVDSQIYALMEQAAKERPEPQQKYVVHVRRPSGDITTFTQHAPSLQDAIRASQDEHRNVWGIFGEPTFAQLQEETE